MMHANERYGGGEGEGREKDLLMLLLVISPDQLHDWRSTQMSPAGCQEHLKMTSTCWRQASCSPGDAKRMNFSNTECSLISLAITDTRSHLE